MRNHYKRSKWQAEQVAIRMAREGLPVIIVNPSAPVGPRDVKPTPTGQVIVDFLNRKMPAYLDTGLNWVHVRDVAVGHILAAEKGRIGERYILGNAEGNWTMKQAFARVGGVDGRAGAQIPHSLFAGAGRGVCRRSAFAVDAPTAQSPAGRRAHGQAQNVFQPRQSDSRAGFAPNAAQAGAGGRSGVVSPEWICEMKAEVQMPSPKKTPRHRIRIPYSGSLLWLRHDSPAQRGGSRYEGNGGVGRPLGFCAGDAFNFACRARARRAAIRGDLSARDQRVRLR